MMTVIFIVIAAYLLMGAAIHCKKFKANGLYSTPLYFFTWCVLWLPIVIHVWWEVLHISDEDVENVIKESESYLEGRGINLEDELKND